MIVFVWNQKLWALEVSWADSHVIVFLGEVEFTQAPVNNSELKIIGDIYFSLLVINHHILGLYVSVHDTHWVAVVKPFQDLVNVVFAIFRLDCLDELLVVNVLYVLKDQTVNFALLQDVEQLDTVTFAI